MEVLASFLKHGGQETELLAVKERLCSTSFQAPLPYLYSSILKIVLTRQPSPVPKPKSAFKYHAIFNILNTLAKGSSCNPKLFQTLNLQVTHSITHTSHIFAFMSLSKLPCSFREVEEKFIDNLRSDNCYPDSLFHNLSVPLSIAVARMFKSKYFKLYKNIPLFLIGLEWSLKIRSSPKFSARIILHLPE